MNNKLKSWLITIIIIIVCTLAINMNLMGEFILFLLGLALLWVIAYIIEDFLDRRDYK